MKIYRRKWRDRNGEERVGRTWWLLAYVGGQRVHESLGVRDKRAAELIAGDRIRGRELRRAGIIDPYGESRERPLAEHLRDFEQTLKARAVVPRYLQDRMGCLRAFVAHRGARVLKDLDLPGASAFLASIADTGVGARTVNRYYQALKQFGLWLVKSRRSQFDPFDGIKRRNEEADRRHVRRALTPEEAGRLIEAARTRPLRLAEQQRIHAGVTPAERLRLTRLGEIRALVYLLAMGTGLRAGEIRALRWADVDTSGDLLHVRAGSAKSRRDQSVPLNGAVKAALTGARPRDGAPGDLVVPAGCFPNSRTFHQDRELAGIEKEDETGRVVDFHALRTTFISWLATEGVHPRVAQALARHASIETTMARYTDLSLMDVRGAAERLPMPEAPVRKKRGRPVTAPRVWDRSGKRAAQ